MTLRLVALMSVVLLLSLGAFGLMINHYQDQLMAEVARTASEAGKAALSTLEARHFAGSHDPIVAGGPGAVWYAVEQGSAGGDVGLVEVEGHTEVHHVEGSADSVRVVRTVTASGRDLAGLELDEGAGMIMIQQYSAGVSADRMVLDCIPDEEAAAGSAAAAGVEVAGGEPRPPCTAIVGNEANRFVISIEGVRAEGDPAHGMVLTVPRFSPDAAVAVDETVEFVSGEQKKVAGAGAPSFEELRLPIDAGDYGQLFKSIRDRSLMLFLGVLAVGTVLSAGVASRFTRPIRKLDAGIRRLSDGDLDVQVHAQGKDEIARLGRAFNDMTRSLRANRQRSREMVRREKLSALGRLAAGVAHDVRNPLHSIGLTLQHLREACRPEDDRRAGEFDRSLEIIRGEVRRLDGLVGNFLQFARSDRRERKPIDLHELLQTTARLVHKEAEWRKVEVALDLDASAPEVSGNAEAIRSSILNLVLNSFEAMPEGGRLELKLRRDNGDVVVEVADDGTGIDEEDQERVFEFAYTTREGGHGLGLAMVHQCVVEEQGGRVELESREGDGTVVRLFLPAGAGDAEPADGGAGAEAQA
jgi:two-component system NtrC family sensor kinase